MVITHDDRTGWSESDGDPRWRSTRTALDRLAGAELRWLEGNPARPVKVLHLPGGTPVCVLRRHAASRRWSVNVEGFEFWQHVRVMNRTMWAGPVGFDDLRAARAFAGRVMAQAGARILPTRAGPAPPHERNPGNEVYRLYRESPDEGRSSYLHDHYRRGLLGTSPPERSRAAAHAAWRAGRDTTKGKKMSKTPEASADQASGAEEREYRVRWEIDVSATSHEEAARKARAIQTKNDSIADVFDVRAHGHDVEVPVDLSEIDGVEC
jgi:hypothetical protein